MVSSEHAAVLFSLLFFAASGAPLLMPRFDTICLLSFSRNSSSFGNENCLVRKPALKRQSVDLVQCSEISPMDLLDSVWVWFRDGRLRGTNGDCLKFRSAETARSFGIPSQLVVEPCRNRSNDTDEIWSLKKGKLWSESVAKDATLHRTSQVPIWMEKTVKMHGIDELSELDSFQGEISKHLIKNTEARFRQMRAEPLDLSKDTGIGSASADSLKLAASTVVQEEQELEDRNFADALEDAIGEGAPDPNKMRDFPLQWTFHDPAILQRPEACERDFKVPCPENFIIDSAEKGFYICSPMPNYIGSCRHKLHIKKAGDTITKTQIMRDCKTVWPCIKCHRDYGHQCPIGFQFDSHDRCLPTPDYKGPCQSPISFWMHNAAMIDRWSTRCDAYFPCLDPNSDNFQSTSVNRIDSLLRRG